MKKSFITLLLAIFMVIPIVGCGEPNMDGDPDANQAKIVLNFVEGKPTAEEGVYTYESNKTKFEADYSDCANLKGAGFYNVGTVASLSIDLNSKVCAHIGWVRFDGTNFIPLHDGIRYNYQIANADAGKTVEIYAVMGLNASGNGGSLNVQTTKFHLDGISITKYTYDEVFNFVSTSYDLDEDNVVELENGDTYRYESNKFIKTSNNSVSLVDTSEGFVQLGGAKYSITRYDSNDDGKINEDDDIEKIRIKLLTLADSTKYLYDGEKIFRVSNGEECLIDKNLNVALTAIYTIVKNEFDEVIGVAEGSVQNNKITETLSDSALSNYNFPTTDLTIKTFKDVKNLFVETYPQKSKLSDINPAINLSYYTNSSGDFQYYKVTWKYGTGLCDVANVSIEFDPLVDAFPANANICLRANIDLTQGITDIFVQDAVKSTFYNQAYVDTVADSACMTTLKAQINVTDTCMYIKNIGALTSVAADERLKLKNTNTYYYGVSTDSLNNERMEGIYQTTIDLMYGTYTYNTLDDTFYTTRYTDREPDYMKSFNLEFGPIYEALLQAIESPKDQVKNLTFGYSKYTNSAVIKSIVVNGVKYHFNYVDSSEGEIDYNPTTVEDGDQPHLFPTDSAVQVEYYRLILSEKSLEIADSKVLEELVELVSKNPQNFMNNDINKLKSNLDHLLYVLLNDKENLRDLRKYELTVLPDFTTKTISVLAVNKMVSMESLAGYLFMYDKENNLYFTYFEYPEVSPASAGLDDGGIDGGEYVPKVPESINASYYTGELRTLIEYINIISSASAAKESATWIKIKSDSANLFIDYSFYGPSVDGNLVYKIRYYYDRQEFNVLSIYADEENKGRVTFVYADPTNLVSLGKAISITDGVYTLTTQSTYTIEKNVAERINTYTINIGGEKHIIDMENLRVYNTVDDTYYDLHLNLAEELKFYFEHSSMEYYGIYYKAPDDPEDDPIFSLYKIEVKDAIKNVVKGDKIGDLVKEGYIALDSGYYLFTYDEGTEEYTLTISPTVKETFKFDAGEYEHIFTIEEILVKKDGKVVNDGSLAIHIVYEIAKDGFILELDAPHTRYILPLEEGVLLEYIQDMDSGDFVLDFNGSTYTIVFEEISE